MVKIGVCFYYVGDIHRAADSYSKLFGSDPVVFEEDWVRFHLEGGDLALHLTPDLQPTNTAYPVRFGAVVSITVEDIHVFLGLAKRLGFTTVGGIEDLPYGFLSELRDPWGNRLSVLEPKEG